MSFVIVEMCITIGTLSLLRTTRADSLALVSIIGFIGISPPTDIHWQGSLGPIFGVFKKILTLSFSMIKQFWKLV